jgi:hypothetical protein
MNPSGKEINVDLVKQEYFHLQKTVEDFDQRGLTIKGWSVTVSLTGIAAAFTQKQPALLLLASLSGVLFWLIETIWKRFQVAYYYRLRIIESFLSGENPEGFTAPRITRDWGTGFRRYGFIHVMFWPHIFLPHFVIAMAGLLLWLADRWLSFLPRTS